MKRVLKYLAVIAVAIAVTISLGGCSKQEKGGKQRRQKFQVVSLDKVSGSLNEGWRVTLTVANNTASNLHITAASAYIRYNGKKIGRIAVDGDVTLPRRRCSQVEVPLRVTLSNPMAAFSIFNKVRRGDFSGITADYTITIGAAKLQRTFEKENVSLEQLAAQFNFGLKK